jgi:hypothetical protein
MAKAVRYPGPAVEGAARCQDQIHFGLGIRLIPGVVFQIPDELRGELGDLVEDVVVAPPVAEKAVHNEPGGWYTRAAVAARKATERRHRGGNVDDSVEAPAESDEDEEPEEGARP